MKALLVEGSLIIDHRVRHILMKNDYNIYDYNSNIQSTNFELVVLSGNLSKEQVEFCKSILVHSPWAVFLYILTPGATWDPDQFFGRIKIPYYSMSKIAGLDKKIQRAKKAQDLLIHRKFLKKKKALVAALSRISLLNPKSMNMNEMLKRLRPLLGKANLTWVQKEEFDFFYHQLWMTDDGARPNRNLSEFEYNSATTWGDSPLDIHNVLSKILEKTKIEDLEKLQVFENESGLISLPVIRKKDFKGVFVIENSRIEFEKSFLEFLSSEYGRKLDEIKNYQVLIKKIHTDDLTGLYNHRYLRKAINHLVEEKNSSPTFSVIFADIDNFKSINDKFGHLYGSTLIREIGQLFRSNLRSSDYCFRYGGDEYVFLLPSADAEGAKLVAERLREMLSKMEFVVDQKRVKLTVSMGVSVYPEHASSPNALLEYADRALFKAKENKKNQVYVVNL